MTLTDTTWQATVNAVSVVQAVETRLARAGAITELRQLQGLSTYELQRLVHREIHWPTDEVWSVLRLTDEEEAA